MRAGTVRAAWLVALLLLVVVAAAPRAQAADRAFAARYTTNDTGDIAFAANTTMTCPASATGCAAAQAGVDNGPVAPTNNSFQMAYVDVDADPTTFSSSRSTLTLPVGATVLFAGLYWGGDSSNAARNQVRFATPTAPAYQILTAQQLDIPTVNVTRYQGFRDVTALVQAGGNGSYTVANVQSSTVSDRYGGWTLVVAYRDPAQPARNLAVFDGIGSVSSAAGTLVGPLTGFRTPATGPVRTTLGVVAYEGDRTLTGDGLQLNSTKLSNALNPVDDFFNSTISRNGALVTSKTPDYVNQLGYDADLVNADGILANNATTATIRLTTGGETYIPGVVTVATELYSPRLSPTKTVTDLNGGAVEQGDVLEYTIAGANTGQDGATGLRATDTLPAEETFVPGSIRFTGGAGTGTKTDAAGDDQAEYDGATRRVVARLGSGADAAAGGTLAPAGSFELRFRATVNADLAPRTDVANQASLTFAGQTLGTPFTAPTTTATVRATSPDLALTKVRGAPLVRGGPGVYTLGVSNLGDGATRGPVTVTDTLPTGLTFAGTPSGAGWACATAGATLTCTRADLLAGASAPPPLAYPSITVPVAVAQNAPDKITNTASVATAGDGVRSDDTASDSAAVSSSASLSLTKRASAPTVGIGDPVSFTLTASNAGPSDAGGVRIDDGLPAGLDLVSATPSQGGCTAAVTCDLGSLAAGARATVVVVARATAAPGGRTLRNTAKVSAATPDPDPSDDAASADVAVTSSADLSLTKTGSPAVPTAGGPVSFTLRATNRGPSTATGVVIVDPLPAALQGPVALTTDPASGVCTQTGGVVRCTFKALAVGEHADVRIDATVDPAAGGRPFSNTGTVSAAEADPDASNNSATVALTPAAAADLRITKRASADPTTPGGELDYTLEATNAGPSTATGVVLRDTLPAGLSLLAADPASASCASSGASLACALGTLAPGERRTVTLRTRVAPELVDPIVNTARLDSDTADPSPSDNAATTKTAVAPSADLRLTKSASPDPVAPGEALTYTLTLTNAGPSSAQSPRIDDTLPDELRDATVTGEGCTLAGARLDCRADSVAPGDSLTARVSGTVDPAATDAVVNIARATSDTPDSDPSNDVATTKTAVAPAADLVVTKVADAKAVLAGHELGYTISVLNAGPSVAREVTVADDLAPTTTPTGATPADACTTDGGRLRCALGDLGPGERRDVRLTVAVDPSFTGEVSNRASAATSTPDPDSDNDSATTTTDVQAAAALVVRKADDRDPAVPGGPFGYRISVANDGPSDARDVTLTDDVPADVAVDAVSPSDACSLAGQRLTCAFGTLPPGASRLVTLDGRLSALSDGRLSNTATASSSTPQLTPGTEQDTETTGIAVAADVRVTKTVPAVVRAGETIAYDLTVTNDGPSPARSVTLRDPLDDALQPLTVDPAGPCGTSSQTVDCSLGTLAPGASRTVRITAGVDPGFAGPLLNRATASTVTEDPDATNDSAQATTDVRPAADLRLEKSASPDPVVAGEPVTFRLLLENAGPGLARAVRVSDPVPGAVAVTDVAGEGCALAGQTVTCEVGDVGPGEQRVVEVTGTVSPDAGPVLANTAQASSTTPDPDPGDESSTSTTTVSRNADLSIAKTASPPVARAGEGLTYTLQATNAGPSTAADARIEDVLPAGLRLVSTGGDSTCDVAGSRLECRLGDLPPGSVRTVTVVTAVDPAARGSLTNTARVLSDASDPNPADDAASTTTPVTADADLSVTKTPDAVAATPGGSESYVVRVRNDGPSTAVDAVLSDQLGPGLTPSALTLPLGCSALGGLVTCRLGDLEPGAELALVLAADVDPGATGSAGNAASVASATADDDPADNTASTDTPLRPSADLRLAKTASPATATAGEPITYRLTAQNLGLSVARDVTLVDDLPDGVSVATAPPGCSTEGAAVTCALGALAPGDSVNVEIVGLVDPGVRQAVENRARLTASTRDPQLADNAASAMTPVRDAVDLQVLKADVADPVRAGESIAWTVSVRNAGPSSAQDVRLLDPLPDGVDGVEAEGPGCAASGANVSCALGTLGPGETRTVRIVGTADPAFTGTLTNTARATSVSNEIAPGDEAATATTTIAGAADVSVTKAAEPATAVAGGPLTYTLVVANAGPGVARDVALEDVVPAGWDLAAVAPAVACPVVGGVVRCSLGDLAPGERTTVVLRGTVDPGALGTLRNEARVSTSTTDEDPGNDLAAVDTPLSASANVRIQKSVAPDPVVAGGPLRYTLRVDAAGPSVARDVVVSDRVPDEVRVDAVAPSPACRIDSQLVTCSEDSLAPDEERTITIDGTLAAGATGAVRNEATVRSATPDPRPTDNSDAATLNSSARADLSVAKAARQGSAAPGELVTWDLAVANAGPSDAEDVKLVDRLPDGVAPVSVDPDGPCAIAGQTVTCELGVLAPGASVPVVIAGRVDEAAPAGELLNTASVSSGVTDLNAANDSATARTTLAPAADLAVTKTVSADPLVAGGPVAYEVRVTNQGPSVARGASLVDDLPAGVALDAVDGPGSCSAGPPVTCSLGDLRAGETETVRLTGTVDPGAAGTLSNTARATSEVADPVAANDTATATATVTSEARVSLDKRAAPSPVVAGAELDYTLTAHNAGPSVARDVVIADPLPDGASLVGVAPAAACTTPPGLVTCALGDIPPGEDRSATVRVRVDPARRAAVVNTATVSTATPDPEPTDDTATTSTPVVQDANVALAKTGPATVRAGETIAWRLDAVNRGPSTAVGVAVTDDVPTGVSELAADPASACSIAGSSVRCGFGDLAPGDARSVTVTGHVAPGARGALDNTARVTTASAQSDTGDDSASSTTAIEAEARLGVQKTAEPLVAVAGEPLTYRIAVINAGPSTSSRATVVDALPDGFVFDAVTPADGCGRDEAGVVRCRLDGLAPGERRELVITGSVDPAARGALRNVASITSDTPDPDPADDRAQIDTPILASADLGIVKRASAQTARPGERLSYTLEVSDAGPSSALATVVTDPLPAGFTPDAAALPDGCSVAAGTLTCSLGTVAAGEVRRLTFVGDIAPDVTGELRNDARVTSDTPDGNPANDTDAVATTLSPSSRLTVEKVADRPSVLAGGLVTFTITARNEGPSTTRGAEVVDALPDGLQLVSATPSQGSCRASVECELGTLAPGAAAEIVVVTRARAAAVGTQQVNRARVRVDGVTALDVPAAQAQVAVLPAADLGLTKRIEPDPPHAGQTVAYLLEARNSGPSVATGVTVRDDLPAVLLAPRATVTGGGAGGSCSIAGRALTCSVPALAAGATATVRVEGRLAAAAAGAELRNSATVQGAEADPEPADNSATSVAQVPPAADLRVTKVPSATQVEPGGRIDYRLEASNAGPDEATGVELVDRLPEGVSLVATPAGCSSDGATVRCPVGTLAVGESRAFALSVDVGADRAGTEVTNVAEVSGTRDEPEVADNVARATTRVAARADLVVAKRLDATPLAGGQASWTIDVANRGPNAATGVTLTDALPAGVTASRVVASQGSCTEAGPAPRCALGTLAPGSGATITVLGNVPASLAGATITNTATVAGAQADPDPAGNVARATGVVGAPSGPGRVDLRIGKRLEGRAVLGRRTAYRIGVTNRGPVTAPAVVVTDHLPRALRAVSAVASAGRCTLRATLTCRLGTLRRGASASILVRVVPRVPGRVRNVASVVSTLPDLRPRDNVAVATARVVEPATSIEVVGRGPRGTSAPGSGATIHVAVRTTGRRRASGVRLCAVLPRALVPVFADRDATVRGGRVCWTVGALASGARFAALVHVRVSSRARTGTIVSRLRATAANAPPARGAAKLGVALVR